MTATMLTVCATGAEIAKEDFPALPTTLEELAETSRTCEAAGAAMIHVHVRDTQHRPTLEVSRLKEAVAAVRENSNLIVQLSTGGAVTDPFENRIKVLDAQPDSCSLSMGTVNFGDDVFMNPWSFITELFQRTQEEKVVPEFEIFDFGQLYALERLFSDYGLPYGGRVHIDFITNVPGGMPGDPLLLADAVKRLPVQVTSWAASGIGRAHLPIMFATVAMGGHLRIGMEDNTFFARGQKVTSNTQLVERAAQVATLAQRPPMSIAEAKDFLQIRPS
ncbi:MAG: 3-keto-5-aminohexanoate cleavage protein [Propionibacteriaceae bacterium]